MKRYLLVFFLSVLVVLGLFVALETLSKPSEMELGVNEWIVVENTIGFDRSILPATFYKVLKKPGYVVLSYQITEGALRKFHDKRLYLNLPQISASFLEVYADGNLVGSFGCSNKRIGYIWYQPLTFAIPNDVRTITLHMNGINELGINEPVFMTTSVFKYSILSFLTGVSISILIGMSLMNGFVLFIFARNSEHEKRREYNLFALGSYFVAIWLLRFMPFETLPSEAVFLILRKIFIASAFFALAFLSQAISAFYYLTNTKFDKPLFIINICAAIALFLAPNSYSFIILNSRVLNFIIFVNAFFIFFKVIKSYSLGFFFAGSFFVLTLLVDSLSLLLHTGQRFLTSFSAPMLFLVSSYNIILDYKNLLVQTRLVYARSITDNLTGAFNRGILNELTPEPNDTFVYMDLNDFKKINDTYGHEIGDEILKLLVSKIRSHIRTNDIVVRMGGDEFMIILKNCSQEKAVEIIEKIANEFNNSHPVKPILSYGVKTFTGNLMETIRQADSLMYQMKYDLKKRARP